MATGPRPNWVGQRSPTTGSHPVRGGWGRSSGCVDDALDRGDQASAASSATEASAASTITRTSGSVPLGRTSTRPSPPSSASATAISSATALGDQVGLAGASADVAQHLGQRVMTAAASSASGRPVRASTSSSSTPVSSPSPVVARSRKITWPDCSPPSDQPPALQRLEHVAVADRALDHLDAVRRHAPGGSPRLVMTVTTTVSSAEQAALVQVDGADGR